MKDYVRSHKTAVAIAIFLVAFGLFHYAKPAFSYGADGEFLPFGVGYRNKTVVPVWVVAIVFAIMSYVAVLAWCRYNVF
jgi:divalent metal cation (Fe/Co/Zn/Cd) transporter